MIKKRSEETRMKLSKAQLGKTHSDETKKKISEAKLGKKLSDETRINISCSQQNISREEWVGFVSMEPYCDVWADKEYKESIKERDNYSCQNPDCWCKESCIAIHHIDYDKKNCKPDNLVTLCNSCNTRANSKRDYWFCLYTDLQFERGITA